MVKNNFGVSLSIKQCRNFGINHLDVIEFAITELNIKRFRLMSYWDEIEIEIGIYNFKYLDQQIKLISKNKGEVTLCLGVRQPRWPESHWPTWTKGLTTKQRDAHLLKFIKTVIERYRKYDLIVSYQLENEALLKRFGENGDFNRKRLIKEYFLIKQLDRKRPIVMTTSTSWGIPFRKPIPDIVGFSFYRVTHDNKEYRKSIYQPWVFKLRARLIKLLWQRPTFIHELQAEPWGPKAIWEMDKTERNKSMSLEILKSNIKLAKEIKLYPIDLWGLEWWYKENELGNNELINELKKLYR